MRFDTTTTDDTTLYVAEAALDPRASGKFAVAGDQLSMKEAIAAYEWATGKKLVARALGSVADLERRIADLKARDPNPHTYLPLQYQHGMVSGRGKLTDHINARYPHIRPARRARLLPQGLRSRRSRRPLTAGRGDRPCTGQPRRRARCPT